MANLVCDMLALDCNEMWFQNIGPFEKALTEEYCALLLQVPLGTYTGWNPIARGVLKGQECSLQAGTIPFARTKAERLAKGDPRPSLEERYGNISKYYSMAVEAANRLIAQRLMLPEDADRELRQLLSDVSKEGSLPLH